MNKNSKIQVTLIVVGLLIIFLGYYFILLQIDTIICILVSTAGIGTVISGIRYKERANRKILTGEERSAYARSAYFIISMMGLVIVLVGLGGGVLANYLQAGATTVWFLIVVFVGMLIMIAGRIVKAADEPKKS